MTIPALGVNEVTDLIHAFGEICGSVAWPLLVLFIIVLFRASLKDLLDRVEKGKAFGTEFSFAAAVKQRSIAKLPEAGSTVITQDDVKKAFSRIPDFTTESIEAHMPGVYANLRTFGVVTLEQLDELVSSEEILDTLRDLYRQELRRLGKRPLDPSAVSAWGAYLYIYGLNERTIEDVRSALRESPEYRNRLGRESP